MGVKAPTVALTAFALAVAVTFVSGNLNARFRHLSESAGIERAILHSEPFIYDGVARDIPPFRNRILVPLFMEASSRLVSGTPQEHFIFWRLATAWAMFALFFYLLRDGSAETVMLGASLLALVLVLSFGHPWEHASDFPDVAFHLGFCALAVARRRYALLVLALVAAGNRESAAFAGVIWTAVHGCTLWNVEGGRWRESLVPREICYGAAVSLLSYGTAVALRGYFGTTDGAPLQSLMLPNIGDAVGAFLAHPNPFSWPGTLLASVMLSGSLFWLRHHALDEVSWKLLLAAGAVFLISTVFGSISELRVFLPAFTVTIFAAVRARTQERTPAPTCPSRTP